MGLFRNLRGTMDDADTLGAAAGPGPAGAYDAGVDVTRPVDLNDPLWQPIDGITLDKYAQLTAAMARQDLAAPDRAQAWLEAQGVKPGTWGTVQAGWVERMAANEAVRTRYGILYSRS